MMRVVAISSALDDDSVPENVVDYVVYHESLHLRQGYRPFRRSHDIQFRTMEKLFPEYGDAEIYLRGLADKIRGDHSNAWEK
jgi:predicted metal-dependent hydrolase